MGEAGTEDRLANAVRVGFFVIQPVQQRPVQPVSLLQPLYVQDHPTGAEQEVLVVVLVAAVVVAAGISIKCSAESRVKLLLDYRLADADTEHQVR